jgi:sugar phosphate isomerase/epimerase
MDIGFVSAILPDLTLEEVLEFGSSAGFTCVELMCWPKMNADRRYAGVTHIDVDQLNSSEAARIKDLSARLGLKISGLGYYPNPLVPDRDEAQVYIKHIEKVILAAEMLGVSVVNSFVGRDWKLSVDANWPRFKEVWPPLVKLAAAHGIRIGIENCPMLFTRDEWPGGKNLAHCPAVWKRMFQEIPDANFGLDYDPSHLLWQRIDYVKPLWEFASRIFHVHAKDARIDVERLNEVGILATPLEFHTPKLPGLGDVNWGRFLSVLRETGYRGAVCVEVEDRAYEDSLESRKQALKQSLGYLSQFLSKE